MIAVANRLPGVLGTAGRLAVKFDLLRGALALLIFLNVSRIHQHFKWMAMFRPALVLAALAAIYAFVNPWALSTRGLFMTREARLIAAFSALACLSAVFGLSLGSSATFILSSYSKVVLAAVLLIAAIRTARDLYTFVWAYVAGCGALAYLSIFVFGLSKAGSQAERLSDLYTFDANDVGLVMLVGLPLTILALQASKGLAKVAAAVILVGIGITLARTGSRGAFVGLLVTGIALLVMLRTVPLWQRASFVVITAVSLVFAAPKGYWDQMSTVLRPKEDYNWSSTEGRREVAKRGISYMLSYPVFGLGINNFWRAECIDPVSIKVRVHQASQGIRCTAPHNSYVQAGAELGIPGLTLWILLVFGSIPAMLRLRRRLPEQWIRGDPEQRFLYLCTMYFAVAMTGFAVGSFFVSFAWVDIVYTIAALMAGLGVSVAQRLATADADQQLSMVPVGSRGRAPTYRPSVLRISQ